jgi:hypothetical protein
MDRDSRLLGLDLDDVLMGDPSIEQEARRNKDSPLFDENAMRDFERDVVPRLREAYLEKRSFEKMVRERWHDARQRHERRIADEWAALRRAA